MREAHSCYVIVLMGFRLWRWALWDQIVIIVGWAFVGVFLVFTQFFGVTIIFCNSASLGNKYLISPLHKRGIINTNINLLFCISFYNLLITISHDLATKKKEKKNYNITRVTWWRGNSSHEPHKDSLASNSESNCEGVKFLLNDIVLDYFI